MSSSPQYVIEQRSESLFAVLEPNPNAGKRGVSYSGDYLTLCTTDGREDAERIARAMNLVFGARVAA